MEYLTVNEHIHLQKLKIAHAPVIFETICENRHFLRRWLPFVDYTRKPRDTEQFVGQMVRTQDKNHDYIYTVWFKGDFAGLAGFKDSDPVNNNTEIGYWLTESMQGKGIMTQTVRKLVDFACRNLNRNRIQIKVATGNIRSAAIPERLGFIFEGTEREGEKHADGYLDLKIYSLLKSEWATKLLTDSGW